VDEIKSGWETAIALWADMLSQIRDKSKCVPICFQVNPESSMSQMHVKLRTEFQILITSVTVDISTIVLYVSCSALVYNKNI
jgi:hypothetical protein